MRTRPKIILLIFVVIIIALAAIAGYVYFTDLRYVEEEPEFREILIKAIDKKTNKPLIVNYTVIGNGTVVATGSTREDSYVKVKVPMYIVITVYPLHSDYYSDKTVIIGPDYLMEMYKIGNISIEYEGNLNQTNGRLNLNISVNESIGGDLAPESVRKAAVCVRWSGNIIEVTNNQYQEAWILRIEEDCKSFNLQWFEAKTKCGIWCKIGLSEPNVTAAHCEQQYISILPPSWLQGKVDSCWATNWDVVEREPPLNFILNYEAYETINEDDFINLYIVDAGRIPELDGLYRYEWNGKNVGADDFLFVIG